VPFVSSDGMRLYIERAKLEREADAFPPPSATLDPGEVVPLEENGETLEMLFRFVDREEYVRLEDVEFDLLARLAEAAHKYRVYSAMSSCPDTPCRAQHDKHPVEVLVYALKHGHSDIADAAAPFTVGRRARDMLQTLPSQADYLKWVGFPDSETDQRLTLTFSQALYNDHFVSLFFRVASHRPQLYGHRANCTTGWATAEDTFVTRLYRAGGVEALANPKLRETLGTYSIIGTGVTCSKCIQTQSTWINEVVAEAQRVPPYTQN
ncbi:hypothetical protein FB107DRAFT_220831, partial [Schizophyllum commune]